MNRTHVVRNPREGELALRGEVIVTTSGMLDGGPVLRYLEVIREDPRSAVLLTGYQVEGTNGRRLVRSEEHTSELQSQSNLVCRLLLEKKRKQGGGDCTI